MTPFALEIKRCRLEAGLTQVQLAEKIGITQGSVASLESGRLAAVSAETLFKLSDALGVKADHWRPFLAADAPGADARTQPAEKSKKRKKPDR